MLTEDIKSSLMGTSNTVAPSCPWSRLFRGGPCSALCSSPSSSLSADVGAPLTWRSCHHRTWKGNLVDQVSGQYGSACPLSTTSASDSGHELGRWTCTYPYFHLVKQIFFNIFKLLSPIKHCHRFSHLVSWCGWVALTSSHYETCAVRSRGSGGTVLFLWSLLQNCAFSHLARHTL